MFFIVTDPSIICFILLKHIKTVPFFLHQMRISTTYVSSVMLEVHIVENQTCQLKKKKTSHCNVLIRIVYYALQYKIFTIMS